MTALIALIKILIMLFMGIPANATFYEDGSWISGNESGCLVWGECND